jgi:hypothetical protein
VKSYEMLQEEINFKDYKKFTLLVIKQQIKICTSTEIQKTVNQHGNLVQSNSRKNQSKC